MRTWTERPTEEANLLNPAFCSLVLCAAIAGYHDTSNEAMPLPIMHMVTPIILRKQTRERLPKTVSSSVAIWLQDNAHFRIQYADRIISLRPYINEAIIFGLQNGILSVWPDGCFAARLSVKDINKRIRNLTGEAKDCIHKALFLGRWFAKIGSPETLMALWGIRP